MLSGCLAEFQIDFHRYRVIDRVGQRLMAQRVRTDLLEHCSVMKQTKTFKWNFRSLLYRESRWSTYSWDVTGFVYGCLFVCDWHLQMVFASSEALMAVVHHSACVSRRGWDKLSPTQVNDQSLQRKWRCMAFESVSLALEEKEMHLDENISPCLHLIPYAAHTWWAVKPFWAGCAIVFLWGE